MYYERNPEKEEKDAFYDTDDTAYFLLKGWCTREMLSVIQILLLKL